MGSSHRIGLNLLPIVPGMGGIRTHVYGLLAGMEMLDPIEEIVLFTNRELASDIDFPFEVVETRVHGSSRPQRYTYEQTLLPFDVRKANVDVLHSPGYSVPLLTDVPTTVTIHDLNYAAIPETFSRTSRFVWNLLVPRSAAAATSVLTVSAFSREQIHSHVGTPKEKITVVPNAPSPTLPSSPKSLVETKLNVERPYLLYVGSTHPHKNHEALVRALGNISKEVIAVFVGPERGAHNRVVSLVESLGLNDRVQMLGFVSNETLATLYANAHLYVHPSRYEGFGMPVLEAMRYGAPVACADAAALPEVAGDAAVYFDPDSPASIASTCNDVINSVSWREHLSRVGADRAAKHTWRDTASQTLTACRSAIS